MTTGISGTTDIEVTNGLKEGDEIVTGSYKVLRTLRNGASVKVDNSAAKKKDEDELRKLRPRTAAAARQQRQASGLASYRS